MKNITLLLSLVLFSVLLLFLVEKYEIRISLLPKCTGIGFYSYYDNKDDKCKCYNLYELKNRICKKKDNF